MRVRKRGLRLTVFTMTAVTAFLVGWTAATGTPIAINAYPGEGVANCQGWGQTEPEWDPTSHNLPFCRTDGPSVSVWASSDFGELGRENINYTVANRIHTPTNLTLGSYGKEWLGAQPIVSGAPQTDVQYFMQPISQGDLDGVTWCAVKVSGSFYQCDRSLIVLGEAHQGRVSACHELGHAIGLTHGTESTGVDVADDDPRLRCMQNPEDPIMDNFGTSNVEVINNYIL